MTYDINRTEKDNQTLSLLIAVSLGDFPAVRRHLKKGADVSAYNERALRVAVERGDKETAKFLCSRGALFGNALAYAARTGQIDTTTKLISFARDLTMVSTLRAGSALARV